MQNGLQQMQLAYDLLAEMEYVDYVFFKVTFMKFIKSLLKKLLKIHIRITLKQELNRNYFRLT